MATERTFAGWMRTAFAAIGIGIAFRGLFGELEPPWLARAIATVFIVLGAVLAIGAERRAAHSFSRLSAHKVDEPQVPRLRWIAYSIAARHLQKRRIALSLKALSAKPENAPPPKDEDLAPSGGSQYERKRKGPLKGGTAGGGGESSLFRFGSGK